MWQISFFFFLLFWENARKKKVPTDPRETWQRVVPEKKNTGDLKRSGNIHTSGAIECSVMRRGEKEKNGFPVLHELAAANMKLTAAM